MLLARLLVTVFLAVGHSSGQPPDDPSVNGVEAPVGYEVRENQDENHDPRPVTDALVPRINGIPMVNTSIIQDSIGSETNNAEEVLLHEDEERGVLLSSAEAVSVTPGIQGESPRDVLSAEENEEDSDYEEEIYDQSNDLQEGERSAQYSVVPDGLGPYNRPPTDGFPPWVIPPRPRQQPVLHHIVHAILNPDGHLDYPPLNIPPPPPPYHHPYDQPFKLYPYPP